MKVKIGPYRNDLVPVRRWERNYEFWRSGDKYYLDESQWKWYDHLSFKLFDKLADLFLPINRWSNSRQRKVKVHVDGYDVWGANHTIALLVQPILLKLREQQHGYPHVENEDVPEYLKFHKDTVQSLETEVVDDMHEQRWAWVLNELIWTFGQYAMGDQEYDRFYYNVEQLEMVWTPIPDKPGYRTMNFNYQKDPTKPAYWVDEEGKKKHDERKQNGLRLFAKYFENLWD